jgi:hypothetical protein
MVRETTEYTTSFPPIALPDFAQLTSGVFRGFSEPSATSPAARELNLATICWVRWLKMTYSPGERACSSRILASAVCKPRTTPTHSKFKTSIFFRMSKKGSKVVPLCNKAGNLGRARLEPLSKSSKSAIRSFVFRLSENPCTALQAPALEGSRFA